MKQQLFIAWILMTLLITGCGPGNTPIASQAATPLHPTSTPLPPASPTELPSPTPSLTAVPSPTPSPPPTLTATASATPMPEVISASNAGRLRREATYALPSRGRVKQATWVQDGKGLLVQTETGTYLLDGTSLEQTDFFPAMAIVAKLEGDQWLVRDQGQRKILSLEADHHQLLTADPQLDELGLDLVSQNAEIAVRKASDDEVEIVSLRTGERQLFNLRQAGYRLKSLYLAEISPDGNMLVVEDTYWGDFYLVSLETLTVAYKLSNLYEEPRFSPDGQYLLTEDNGGFKVLKVRNGIQVNRFSDGFVIRPKDQPYVFYRGMASVFLPDSQRVGVVYCIENEKCEAYIWSMATGQPEKIVKGLPGGIRSLDFKPDGASFVTYSSEGRVVAWDVASQAILAESQPFDRAEPVLSPDGGLIAMPRGGQIEIYHAASGELWQTVGDYPGLLDLKVDLVSADSLLVAGIDASYTPFAELWDLASGEPVRRFKPLDFPNSYSSEAYCTLDQQRRILVCGSSPLQIFDVETGALLYSNKSQDGYFTWALSPDGRTLASCTEVYKPGTYDLIPTDRIFILDLLKSTSVIANVLEAPQGGICSPMVFSPDSQYLAAQSGFIWQMDQGQLLASFPMQARTPLVFSPDGNLLVSGNRLIQTDNGEVLAELATDSQVKLMRFDPDGYRLFLQTDRGIEVWSVR